MITSAPQLLHKYSFSDTTKTGPEDKGGGSQFRKMQLKMAVAQIKLLRNKRHAVIFTITQPRECLPNVKWGIASLIFAFSRCYEISELITVRNIFEEKYGKDFVSAAVNVCPSCDVNHMLLCDRGHTHFVDSALADEVVAKSASDTMVATQVAAYLNNTDCNQDVDIVSLKKIKEDSPLSLVVSLRSIREGRF
ncbi:hypothetical protein ACFX2F_022662 [Malus domestica]